MAHDGDVKLEHRLEDFAVEQTCRDCTAAIDLVRTIMDPCDWSHRPDVRMLRLRPSHLGRLEEAAHLRRPGN